MDSSLARRIPQRQQLAGTPLFDGPPPPEERHTPVTPVVQRRRKSRDIQEAGARRWINAGRQVAVQVAKRDGKVTAETFRIVAEELHALPPAYGNQRAYSWISALFAELCAEGLLRKVRHPNGAPVKVYSKESRNDQVVYELTEGRP